MSLKRDAFVARPTSLRRWGEARRRGFALLLAKVGRAVAPSGLMAQIPSGARNERRPRAEGGDALILPAWKRPTPIARPAPGCQPSRTIAATESRRCGSTARRRVNRPLRFTTHHHRCGPCAALRPSAWSPLRLCSMYWILSCYSWWQRRHLWRRIKTLAAEQRVQTHCHEGFPLKRPASKRAGLLTRTPTGRVSRGKFLPRRETMSRH